MARVFPAAFRTPEHGCSRLCLRVSFGEIGAADQKSRITVRDHSNARPNPRVAQGPPQASGQPNRAVTTPDVTAPRARRPPHAFRIKRLDARKALLPAHLNKPCTRTQRLTNKLCRIRSRETCKCNYTAC